MPNLITLTGPSMAGKSESLNFFLKNKSEFFIPEIIPKYTTRDLRDYGKDQKVEVICVDQDLPIEKRKLPPQCDLVYEQYGARYGISFKKIYNKLSKGISPIVIFNDVRVVEDVQAALGNLVKSVFLFRESPQIVTFENIAQKRNIIIDRSDIERRFQKALSIYRIYIENIHLFQHVILNTSTLKNLESQIQSIVNGLQLELHWPLKKEEK